MATVLDTQILPPKQGLSSMLGGILSEKFNQYQQQKQMRSGLEALMGPEKAAELSQLPPELLKVALPQQIKAIERQRGIESLQQMYGIPRQVQSQQFDDTSIPAAQTEFAGITQPSIEPGLTSQQQPGLAGLIQPPAEQYGYTEGSVAMQALAAGTDMGTAMKLEQKAKESAQRERLETRKERSEFRKEAIAEQREIDKETLPFYRDTTKAYKGAKETEQRIGRMENLVREGKLDSPQFSSLLDTVSKGLFGFGINLDALRSPDSQEFKKLSVEFLKNAKNLFGPRVTQSEIQMFMQMVPTLQQSDKGKLRVINNMSAYNEADKLKKKAMDQIINENNGRRPRNIEMLVDNIISPQLDALAAEFKKGFNISAEPESDKSSIISKLNPVAWSPGLSKLANWLGDY